MKIVLVHNYYQQPGGEDQVFHSERQLLTSFGHNILQYVVHNDSLQKLTNFQLAKTTLWNSKTYKDLQLLFSSERPDVVHFHNTFPLISPSAYYAARSRSIPIVQTLHNYRHLCPQGMLFREGSPCELCLTKSIAWPGIRHACYRDSRLATGGIAMRNFLHYWFSTWHRQVDLYIALSEFSREKFIQGGLPSDKIMVKPNFVNSPQDAGEGKGNFALFVGRLSHEKGVQTLFDAWKILQKRIPLKIVGDGPLFDRGMEYSVQNTAVEMLGRKDQRSVFSLMKDATVLIFPSLCYENMPLVILEAYSMGLPVIGSRLGSMISLIKHQTTGLHFCPNDAGDLARQVNWIFTNPHEVQRLRTGARKDFEKKFTDKKNHGMLMEIYARAIVNGNTNKVRFWPRFNNQ